MKNSHFDWILFENDAVFSGHLDDQYESNGSVAKSVGAVMNFGATIDHESIDIYNCFAMDTVLQITSATHGQSNGFQK